MSHHHHCRPLGVQVSSFMGGHVLMAHLEEDDTREKAASELSGIRAGLVSQGILRHTWCQAASRLKDETVAGDGSMHVVRNAVQRRSHTGMRQARALRQACRQMRARHHRSLVPELHSVWARRLSTTDGPSQAVRCPARAASTANTALPALALQRQGRPWYGVHKSLPDIGGFPRKGGRCLPVPTP